MMALNRKLKRKPSRKNAVRTAIVCLLIISMVLQLISNLPGPSPVAEAGTLFTIDELAIGDKVVDKSWSWEYRTGPDYTHLNGNPANSETKPVVWIIVAKNHYSGGEAGSVSGGIEHVTLISEEAIGKHAFDNSENRGHEWGSNHWGDSGKPDALAGIRPFLNSLPKSGSPSYAYRLQGFYNAMSYIFKSAVLETALPNKVWETGTSYSTTDKIFLPSTTELGDNEHHTTHQIGTDWGYFTDNDSRIALEGAVDWQYWTRSPRSTHSFALINVDQDGDFVNWVAAIHNDTGANIRPAVNISSEAVVIESHVAGLYEIVGIYGGPLNITDTFHETIDGFDSFYVTGNVEVETNPMLYNIRDSQLVASVRVKKGSEGNYNRNSIVLYHFEEGQAIQEDRISTDDFLADYPLAGGTTDNNFIFELNSGNPEKTYQLIFTEAEELQVNFALSSYISK